MYFNFFSCMNALYETQVLDLLHALITVSLFFLQNALLPAGLRQKDQTTKTPTGNFNREGLLKYLEKEAMDYKDRDDIVPFTGEKKGLCSCTTFDNQLNYRPNKYSRSTFICFMICILQLKHWQTLTVNYLLSSLLLVIMPLLSG